MTATVHSPMETMPGPRALPLVGRSVGVLRYLHDPIGYTSRLFQQYGPLVSLVAGGGTNVFSPYGSPGTIFVYGPDLIRQTRTPHERWSIPPLTGTLYPTGDTAPRKQALKHFMARPWGLDGDEHRMQRKLVLPAFHTNHIAAYRDAMVALTHEMLDRWRPGMQINVAAHLRQLTARITTTTLFGENTTNYREGAGQTLQEAIQIFNNPLTTLLPYDLPGLPYHRFLDRVTRFGVEMRAIIGRKRAGGHNTGDVLTVLLHARDDSGAVLDENELIAWVGSLFAAGHDTSSLALTWTLLLLTQHPHIAADLVDELAGTLHGDAPTIEHLRPTGGHLPLLHAVVKESLRLIPPVPFTWRYAAEPLELGGYAVPQGTEVYNSIYHTHHLPELYAEPERFFPRRWETITPSTWEYIPFNAGPRRCVGAEFAVMEITIVLGLLLQRCRLEYVPRVPIDRAGIITIGPKHGLPVIVHKHDRRFGRGVGGVRGNVREMVKLPD